MPNTPLAFRPPHELLGPLLGSPRLRIVLDETGRYWRVYERDAATVPGARGSRCLVCESIGLIRRLWDYPGDWRERSDAELAALCAD